MLGDNQDDVLDLLDLIERGFDDIEHRIANMDKEHTKYVRATVTRMNYLLSGETDTGGSRPAPTRKTRTGRSLWVHRRIPQAFLLYHPKIER